MSKRENVATNRRNDRTNEILRFDGVKYYVPHGARPVVIDGEKHYLCVPVKGRGATRAVPVAAIDKAPKRQHAPDVPYAHAVMCRDRTSAPVPVAGSAVGTLAVNAFVRRWLLILVTTLTLLVLLLGCHG